MPWDRVRGHEDVKARFLSAHERGRLGQAYLFAGPDGIGKRLVALELAKSLLCERSPAPLTPCGKCPGCVQVEAGTHPDLFRLTTPEGKHELPVEQMREFCARMSLKASRGTRKVGIVEDADDFNEESANSFLKTLEEPPAGAMLILLASSTDRQLPTILSRCQVVRFSPLSPDDLRAVLVANGIIDPTQRERLVRLGQGSAGAALALADADIDSVRNSLLEGLTSPRPNFANLAELWSKFVEEAGKDTAAQRQRASLLLRFLIEALDSALRLSLGAGVKGLDAKETDRLAAFAERVGTEAILDLIDRCLEADLHVERRAQIILVIESVIAPFIRASHPAATPR